MFEKNTLSFLVVWVILCLSIKMGCVQLQVCSHIWEKYFSYTEKLVVPNLWPSVYYVILYIYLNVIIIKSNVLLPLGRFWLLCFGPLVFLIPKRFHYLGFQSFDFKHAWWRLFQRIIMSTKLNLCVFIFIKLTIPFTYMCAFSNV